MGKIILSLATSVLFLCGCTSVNLDSGKLSESEKLTIIDMARYTITKMKKNKKFASAAEADIISKTMPEVKVLYSGPRQGKMTMSWELKNKTINFVYSGEFLTDKAMWKMSISKHIYKISKKRVNPFQKHIKIEATDFDDLRRKSKTTENKR
ncbi:MAG: hypothetical protein KOO69_08280 [Victivallales bacterium]|nr:hypothetical protein [Victivallales bacterium]